MKKTTIICIIILFAYSGFGQQNGFNTDTINNHFLNQLSIAQQEKIHVHTDRSLYIQGEQIWFKIYLVDDVLHRAKFNSRYVYVELVNQQKNVAARVKIRANNNMFYGNIDLPSNLTEGNYTLRAYTQHMQNLGEDYFFAKNIKVISPLSLRIKANIDFDYNEKNEKITARLSYTDNGQQINLNKDILKIKIDDKPENIYYNIEDKNAVRFSFDKNKTTTLHTTLDIEGIHFLQDITVPRFPLDFDVSFFPEGGYLLEGASCGVTFKALNTNGLAETITGEIVDSDGAVVFNIETLHLGMGKFYLNVEKDKKYYAVCRNDKGLEKRFELPQAQKNTYSLKTNWVKDNLYVTVQKSADIETEKQLYILMHTRGITLYADKWNFSDRAIILNKNDFQSGVLQILLLDSQLNPVSERLIFNINDKEKTNTEFKTNKNNYEAREKITAKVKITDADNTTIKGNFSVSVTDNSDSPADTTISILSTLLLTSEIKGYVENPNFYFQNDNKTTTEALDILMQTQGWRRYNVPEILKGNYEQAEIDFEKGQKISGSVKKYSGSDKTEGSSVMIYSKNPPVMDYISVDENGKFLLENVEFPDSMTFTIQAFNKKGKRYVELFIDNDTFPSINNVIKTSATKKQDIKTQEQDEIFAYEKGVWQLFVDELIVTAKRKERKQNEFKPWYASSATQSITEEKIKEMSPLYLSDILRTIPNITVSDGQVIYSGAYSMSGDFGASVAILVDGVAINNNDDSSFNIDMIDVQNVKRVDIFKRSQTHIFGLGGGDLVVAITTGTFSLDDDKIKFNLQKISPLGYQQPSEFYSPKYQTPAQKNNKEPDLRTTIFWKPNITINENGEAVFDFYSADYSTTYSVIIEGITDDGKIINSINKISRK
ncbi:MAG: TonB-dependent receptor plug domain-containing protein [Prevotellaceae bacterium]|jgi:hypothetical protein|nr:TonB-dependent receptor plug domain-containing protein [Prevotellaceae bacterium]